MRLLSFLNENIHSVALLSPPACPRPLYPGQKSTLQSQPPPSPLSRQKTPAILAAKPRAAWHEGLPFPPLPSFPLVYLRKLWTPRHGLLLHSHHEHRWTQLQPQHRHRLQWPLHQGRKYSRQSSPQILVSQLQKQQQEDHHRLPGWGIADLQGHSAHPDRTTQIQRIPIGCIHRSPQLRSLVGYSGPLLPAVGQEHRPHFCSDTHQQQHHQGLCLRSQPQLPAAP